MMTRISVLLLLSLLSACANYSGPSRPGAPVSTSEPASVRDAAEPVAPAQEAARSFPVQVPPQRVDIPAQPETAPPPEPVPETPRERAAPAGTPASTLLASVDQAIADGDLERAAAVSERALRISPRDAYLWYRLASIRYQQQRYGEAEGFARRALSFAGNDGDLSREINNLLGQISQR
jgi:hypothetical protein